MVSRLPGFAFAVLTVLVAARLAPLLHLDAAVSDAAVRFARSHSAWRATMSAITHTADTRVLLPALLLGLAFALWRRDRPGLLFTVAAAVSATVLRLAVLTLLHRPRPPERLTATAGWAFPSGHTTSATIAAGILVALLWPLLPAGRARTALLAVAGAWAALVGISRVALGAHWPTDVLGGWLLAATVLLLLLPLRKLRTQPRPDRQ